MLGVTEHEDGRRVWACYNCGQPTEHEVRGYTFQPAYECLCPDCEGLDDPCEQMD
jgi:hypothetical protein